MDTLSADIETEIMPSRQELRDEIRLYGAGLETVVRSRMEISDILAGLDKRIIVMSGPCSLHDREAALEYADRLAVLNDSVQDKVLVIMRAYVEKPRTIDGWKGMVSDPLMNGSNDLAVGIMKARRLMRDLLLRGVALVTEFLDPLVAPYLSDLVTVGAIGARTVESQVHRQLASLLPVAVGYKNTCNGDITPAVNAMQAAALSHTFCTVDGQGRLSVTRSQGNPRSFLLLRGGKKNGICFSNAKVDSIRDASSLFDKAGLRSRIIVDASHANSSYDHRNQVQAVKGLLPELSRTDSPLLGIMLESNLNEGRQNISGQLEYGVSVTDSCIGWEETEALIREIHNSSG